MERVANLPKTDREIFEYSWDIKARPNQLPPPGDWTYWLMLAGRGFGKTRAGAEQVRAWAKDYDLVNLIGATADDARDIMIEGESGILAVCPDKERPTYIPSKRQLKWQNGSKTLIFTADEPERLRGKQHSKLWCDEIASWRRQESWLQAMLGLRLGDNPQAVITTTPKPIDIIRQLIADPDTVVVRGTTYDNRENLAPAFYSSIIKQYEGTHVGRQELMAELLEEMPGSLWTRALIESLRVSEEPTPFRRIISWDPATTSKKTSDEHGIIVCSIGPSTYRDGQGALVAGTDDFHGYVIEDLSDIYSPDAAAQTVIDAYHRLQLDRVVAETNQGGDMIETILRTKDPTVAYTGITASESKRARAENVSALYEQMRIHHVGCFPSLEDEQCTWTGPPMPSPNRIDAVVHGFAHLFQLANRPEDRGIYVVDFGEEISNY